MKAHPHRELAESVRLLVAAGADINVKSAGPDGNEWTALMYAAGRPCCTVVQDVLLRAGADASVRSSPCGSTALHVAAQVGLAETCELLLTHSNSLLEMRDNQGRTALKLAATDGRTDAVKLLLRHGADINAADKHSATPLFAASHKQHIGTALCLLEAGADVNALDSNGHSALRAAVWSNNTALFESVLSHGADIGVADILGQNELFTAAMHGHVCMMQLLVQHGFSVHTSDTAGHTPLIIAATAGQRAAVEWLLQQGAAIDAAGTSGDTALHSACGSKSCTAAAAAAAVVELLLANGADVNRINPETRVPPLDVAVVNGNLQCAKALVAAGADVNYSNFGSLTSLHMAIMARDPAVVQFLLDHGATAVVNTVIPTICFYGGCCASTVALMLCSTADTVKQLLAAGADVHATNTAGDTCLHVAARHNYKAPVLCLLIKAGADLQAVNSSGKTAAQLAHNRGNVLIEQLLNRAAQQEH
jgi:uncharacterized protein